MNLQGLEQKLSRMKKRGERIHTCMCAHMRKKIRYLTTYKKYNVNTWTVGVPEGEERVEEKKLLKEIMAKNFS